MNSNTEGTISFVRGNDELLEEISDAGIKVGQHIKYEYNDNQVGNHYLVTIDDEEFNIPSEMANNIFIKV